MGCALSGVRLSDTDTVVDQGTVTEEEVVVAPLSDMDKHIIKETWATIRRDVAKVGVIVFVKLFETHPECKDSFLELKGVDDLEMLRTSQVIREHGLRVMSIIEKAVARIEQTDRLDQLTMELGRKHYQYQALPKYYEYVGAEFIQTIQSILKERWSSDVEQAWQMLFLYISSMMRRGYQEGEREQRIMGSQQNQQPRWST